MRKRTIGALAVPVIAVLAILVTTQVFSTGGTATKQPTSDATTGQAVTPEPAVEDGLAGTGAEPEEDADAEHQDELEQEHAGKWSLGDPDEAAPPRRQRKF